MDIQGKTALITGAGRGIGRAAALRLADEGVRLMLAARSEDQLKSVCAEAAQKGADAAYLCTDAAKPADLDALVETSLQTYGQVDILVNNAGVAVHYPIYSLPQEVWDLTMAVNVRAPYLLSKALWNQMAENGGGRIINISSVAGKRAAAHNPAYAASKFAVCGLSESLSRAGMKQNILACAVCPGPVATVMRAGNNPDEDPATILTPKDIAETVAFLLKMPARVLIREAVIELNPSRRQPPLLMLNALHQGQTPRLHTVISAQSGIIGVADAVHIASPINITAWAYYRVLRSEERPSSRYPVFHGTCPPRHPRSHADIAQLKPQDHE